MSKQATKTRSSWSEKLDQSKGLPKVVPIGPTMSRQWGEGTVVVPTPREVDEIMKAVPAGKLITIQEIPRSWPNVITPRSAARLQSAFSHGSRRMPPKKTTSPNAAAPLLTGGTLKSGGFLNEKFPGGVSAHRAKLEAEGHDIVQRGQKFAVVDYKDFLVDPATVE